ncbi:MAG: anti-sigma factor antagonist [Clostridia bacterium]|nr:anti-sigma factor antagonist [Clostridia bacterium]
MEIKYSKSGGSLTVYLKGELDEFSALGARDVLDKLILDNINSERIVFDLSDITFMDSTGIGLLIGRYKKIKRFNRQAYIAGANVATEKVIQLAGLYNIMPKF